MKDKPFLKKAGFQNKARLEHIGGKNFELLEDLIFYSAEHKKFFTAPAGITTDLASIPRIAQSFCQVLGNNLRSAILHDFHCTKEGKYANKVNQKETDDLFLEGLKVDEVRWGKARIMYSGVTLFQRIKYRFKRGAKYDE